MTLRLSASQVARLREHLLRPDELERFAFVYCGESGGDLVATEFEPIRDEELGTQHRGGCRPRLDVERELVAECRGRGMHPVAVHSHPFSRRPGFSGLDRDIMEKYGSWLTGLYPGTVPAFAVLGTEGVEAAVHTGEELESLPVEVVGDWKLDGPFAATGPASPVAVDRERYDRSIRAVTEAGQEALAAAHVGVVGAGGLGSLMAEELARYGVSTFTVVDPDVVEASNLPRLFGAHGHHVGRPKVEAVREHLWRVSPGVEVTAVQDLAEDAEDALKRCDVLMAGVDRVSARSFLNAFAVRHLVPYVDAGVVIETEDGTIEAMEGYIQLVAPGANACFDCLDRGDPERARLEGLSEEELGEELARGYIEESDLAPEPAVVPLNGVVASKAVSVVAKLVTGYAAPEDFLRYEGIGNTLVELTTSRDRTCVTCGDHGVLGRGDREATAEELDAAGAGLDLALDVDPVAADGGGRPSPSRGTRLVALLAGLRDRLAGGIP